MNASVAPAADLWFADIAVRQALADHLELLCRPEAHEGGDLVRIKSNPSRTVWRWRMGGQGYYLKHYHSRSVWHRLGNLIRGDDAGREVQISRLMRSAGVRTIEVVAAGRVGRRSWMLSREIDPAVPLNIWHDRLAEQGAGGNVAVRRVAARLAEHVGRMHALGLFHGDLHAGNILLADPDGAAEPVIMDLHRIRRCRRMRRRLCALDLAMLMHDRLHATTASQRLSFLRRYLRAAAHTGSLRAWAAWVAHLAAQHRRRQLAARDRRIRGTNRYFAPLRLAEGWRGRVMLTCKRASAPSALENCSFTLDQWREALARPSELPGKNQLRIGGRVLQVSIQRSESRGGWRGIVGRLGPSPAMRGFLRGHALVARRIAAPPPLAALERWANGRRESLLITEAAPGVNDGRAD